MPISDTKFRAGVSWENTKAMTQDDIDRVKLQYVDAAKAAREAGFDAIEIHGANGSVLFFSVELAPPLH